MENKSVFSDTLLEEIRSRFTHVESDPFSGKRIYFENAGGTLKLKSIFEVLKLYTALPDNAGRGNDASKEIDRAISKGRSDIAVFLGAKSGKIIAEQSVTGMIFRILNTIARNVNRGNLVTSNLDHASAYDATRIIADRYGMESRIAKLDPKSGIVPVESVLKNVDKNTVALTIIHASNILGTKNDITTIVKEVRKVKPDIYIILDGAQHGSHGKIDIEEYGADAYIFVPHDNLLGKPGDYWDLGTREVAAYACMSKVVEYLQWLGSYFTKSDDVRTKVVEGMKAIERYESVLLKALLHGTNEVKGMLGMDNVSVYGETQNLDVREAIIAFNINEKKTDKVVDYFGENGVRLHNRISDAYSKHTLEAMGIKECLRVSLCHYNTVDEVNMFLKLLNNYNEKNEAST
jgi:selenocysteine lyase/cysteine desulfurase